MRTLAGRSYWGPRERNRHLRRFAFIGDSYVFGQGVGPDETLPACAERYLNEAYGGWPVEAVNLGVSGYNIWNSWLAFKRTPQVYDAIILTLCNNDAQLFERTFGVAYENRVPLWDKEHFFNKLITACFDDISTFVKTQNIPIAVCYYNFWAAKEQVRIGQIIGDLCDSHGIPFVDFFSHFTERSLPLADLMVSEGDYHPSKLAHDAAARHLVLRLGITETFGALRDDQFDKAPGRIMSAVQHLSQQDEYPSDAAMNWAISALECKHRAARRAQLMDSIDTIAQEIVLKSACLKNALADWHLLGWTTATVDKAITHENGIAPHLSRIDEEMLRLDELSFATAWDDSKQLMALLPKSVIGTSDDNPNHWIADARRTLAEYDNDWEKLISFCRADCHVDDTVWSRSHDENTSIISNLVEIARIAEKAKKSSAEFLNVLNRLELNIPKATENLPDEDQFRYFDLLRSSVTGAIEGLHNIQRMLVLPPDMTQAERPAYTTIEVTIGTHEVDEGARCFLEVQINSRVPSRFPLRNGCAFRLNGSQLFMTFRFPVVYAGKVLISLHWTRDSANRIGPELLKLNIYNHKNVCTSFGGQDLVIDNLGRLVTPDFYLLS